MKIIRLETNPNSYSSNVYFLLGNWNKLDDINTLVDTGADDYILKHIDKVYTGVGKRRIEKVVLTHSHFDHTGGLDAVREAYKPKIYAFIGSNARNIDIYLKNGDELLLGDCIFQVIHTPGHSYDSLCLYCHDEGLLFSGDTPINIRTPGGSYTRDYVEALERLASLDIKKIYPGHDDPIEHRAHDIIINSLTNVRKSRIIS